MATPLEELGFPLFFKVADPGALGLAPPEPRLGLAVRTLVRSLSEMQKEALIVSSASGAAWRLASDEGPYLDGADIGPCPLAFMTTGMAACFMEQIRALAEARGIAVSDIRLVLDNYYTMEGSALKGTMIGGALSPELDVAIDSRSDEGALHELVRDALAAAPVSGLLGDVHKSLFTLTRNGREVATGEAAALGRPALPDPGDVFPRIARAANSDGLDVISRTAASERKEGVAGGVGTSLQDQQSRKLHVRGTCTLGDDEIKLIDQELFSPIGSKFRFRSEEAEAYGGKGRAPDWASYVSAGIGFCFMTQIGRYAKILRKALESYRIVQDTHFSPPTTSGARIEAGRAGAVETHLYLTTAEDDAFARRSLEMGERTCFLHALCRAPLAVDFRLRSKAD